MRHTQFAPCKCRPPGAQAHQRRAGGGKAGLEGFLVVLQLGDLGSLIGDLLLQLGLQYSGLLPFQGDSMQGCRCGVQLTLQCLLLLLQLGDLFAGSVQLLSSCMCKSQLP